MEVLKTFKNIDLIKVGNDQYCVRRRYKSLFGRDKAVYYILDRNGTDFTDTSLFAPVTISELSRAEHIYNVQTLKLGII